MNKNICMTAISDYFTLLCCSDFYYWDVALHILGNLDPLEQTRAERSVEKDVGDQSDWIVQKKHDSFFAVPRLSAWCRSRTPTAWQRCSSQVTDPVRGLSARSAMCSTSSAIRQPRRRSRVMPPPPIHRAERRYSRSFASVYWECYDLMGANHSV